MSKQHPLATIAETQFKKTSNSRRGQSLFKSRVFRFPEDSPSATRKLVSRARRGGGELKPLEVKEFRGRGLTEKKDGTFFWQPIVNGKFGKPLVISGSLAAKLA